MRHLQDKEMRLTAELNNDKKQLEHVLYTIKRLNEELFEEQGKLDVYQLDIEKDKNEVEELRAQQTSSKAKLDNFVRESSEIQNNIYKLEKDIAVLNIQKEALQQESLRTISDTSSKEAELSEFNIVVDDLEERVAQQQEQFDNALQAEEELQTQMQIIEKRLQETREQLNREARLVDAKQNEYNLTKSLVDNLEGFPESIKFLRKNAGWKKTLPFIFGHFILSGRLPRRDRELPRIDYEPLCGGRSARCRSSNPAFKQRVPWSCKLLCSRCYSTSKTYNC